MKVKYYNNASILIQHKETKILFDPWLIGQANYGSWSIFPELKVDWSEFDDLDYICISHIHTDHLHIETLKKISNEIPILIHKWDDKFVKFSLERIGKKVIELNHGEKFKVGEDLDLFIYAADGCDPEACFKFFGCGKKSKESSSVGIDTFSVLKSNDSTFVQINDCPLPLMEKTIKLVKNKFKTIDLLFLSFTGAGSYPQCWSHYNDEEKIFYGQTKKNKFLNWGVKILNILKPKYYMPYAGQYVLSGFLSKLEKFKVTPTRSEALSFYEKKYSDGVGFCLNQNSIFDLDSCTSSSEYKEISEQEKSEYIENVLSKIKFDYELDDEVTLEMLLDLIPHAYQRYSAKKKQMNFTTDTTIFLYLLNGKVLEIPPKSDSWKVLDEKAIQKSERYVTYKINPKLLYRILRGPRYAHLNNAEGGSHIEFTRKPEVYERDLYYCMNYFHR